MKMWSCGNCCTNKSAEVEFLPAIHTGSIGFAEGGVVSKLHSVSPEMARLPTIHDQYKELVDNPVKSTTSSIPVATAKHRDVPQDEDMQKETLRRLVKKFARASVKGVEVTMVEKTLLSKSKCLFLMSPDLSTVSISSLESDATDICFNISEVTSVSKTPEIEAIHQWLSGSSLPSTSVVSITYAPKDSNQCVELYFTFTDGESKLQFYASLRILWMASTMCKRSS